MFFARITVDLPSEPLLRRRTLVDWLAQMLGREIDLNSGEELCTSTGVSVFKAVSDALARVGITDVLSVTVDAKTAYVDTEENTGDLAAAVAELDARAVLGREFESMTMVSMHREGQLRTLVEVELDRRIKTGSPELRLSIASRHDAMQIVPGEGPATYAGRLCALASEYGPLSEARARLDTLTAKLEDALREELGELALSTQRDPLTLRLIRPGLRAIDRMRDLPWGAAVRSPRYRPLPAHGRIGAYREPFSHHYFDPYFDFATYVTLTEVIAGRGWATLNFEVVEADGSPAFTHETAAQAAAVAGGLELPAGDALISIRAHNLLIHALVPHLEGPSLDEFIDPTGAPGFAGGGQQVVSEASAGAEGASAGVSGGDMGGSCGASCGGCGG